jgi:hypothetical protein
MNAYTSSLQPLVLLYAAAALGRSTPATKTCRWGPRLAQSGITRAFGPEALCLSKLDNHLLQNSGG